MRFSEVVMYFFFKDTEDYKCIYFAYMKKLPMVYICGDRPQWLYVGIYFVKNIPPRTVCAQQCTQEVHHIKHFFNHLAICKQKD